MESPSAGSVVLVRFPFSDLSKIKRRPAVVLAEANREDFVLCQITSKPYTDANAVKLTNESFTSGSLRRVSYARPGKLFTANADLFHGTAGELKEEVRIEIVDAIIEVLRAGKDDTRLSIT